ncbi:MAG: DUF1905 domain-containing protein [Dehalococcoidia bacterium]
MDFDFTATVWLWDGPAAWHFITVPPGESEAIRSVGDRMARGFGSVRVCASIGTTRWETSVFPQKSDGTYVLPLKKQVRTAEGITIGDEVDVHLEVLDS